MNCVNINGNRESASKWKRWHNIYVNLIDATICAIRYRQRIANRKFEKCATGDDVH